MNLLLAFENPNRLWALLVLPLLIALYIILLRRGKKQGMRFTNTTIMRVVMPPQSRWRRHVAVAMALASLLALGLAWARPMGVDKVPRQRATVVMVLDVSRSMAAVDVKPNRLEAAQAAAKKFLSQLPASYNVSVVSLSGSPAVRVPPTTDRAVAERAIGTLQMQDSTAIGGAIYASLGAISQAPKGDDGKAAPALIILLSDGQNTMGQAPMQAAAAAHKKEVAVYTVAYGTQNGYVDLEGKRELVPPDRELLSKIAQESGGKSYTAESASQLSDVYKTLKSEVGYEEVRKEVTAQWAGYALAFAVVAALGAISMGARWPR